MKLLEWFLLVFVVLSISYGQVLFKSTAQAAKGKPLFEGGILALISQPSLYAAFVLYFIATMAWIWLLRNVELSMAYPFMALCFLIVPLASTYYFNEPLTSKYFIGVGFIICGLAIINITK